MKRLAGIMTLVFVMCLPALAQWRQNRMSPDDQRKFDSYYSHWIDARQKNDGDEIVSAEKRMQNLMARYGIPQNVPYERLVSNGGGYGGYNNGNYGRSDRDEDRDEDRDRNRNVYGQGGYGQGGYGQGGYGNRGARMSADDQRKFDSYYAHWLDARRKRDGDEISSAEKRMQNLMARYGIPQDVPYDRLASNGRY